MIRTEEQALEDLGDDLPALTEIVRNALIEFSEKHSRLRADQSKRSEASNIHDYMVKHARKLLEDRRDIRLTLRQNLFLVHIAGKYSIKLKKLDEGHHAANNVTQMVLDFRDQQPQLELHGVEPAATNLYLGYERGSDTVELTNLPIWLVCPRGNGIAWAIRLDDATGSAAAPAQVTPAAGSPPRAAAKAKRRKEAEAEAKDDEQTG